MEAPSGAGLADQVDAAQVAHAHLDHARAFASLAATAGGVEGEVALAEAPGLGFRRGGEEVADKVEGAGVGGGVGAGRAPDGLGVHGDDAVEGGVCLGSAAGHHLVQQGGLARARAARHDVEGAKGEFHIQVLEVVAMEALEAYGAPLQPGRGSWLGLCARQPKLCGCGIGPQGQAQQIRRGPAPQQLPPGGPGAGAQVDEPVRGADQAGLVLHHHHGLALVAQALEHADEGAHFAGMQPRRGLVQHQEEAPQLAQGQTEQAQALGLAARKTGRGAIQAQVAQAQLQHQIAAGQELVSNGCQHGGFGGSADISRIRGQQGLAEFADAEGRQVHDAPPTPGHGQSLGPQARSPAGGAGAGLHEAQDGVVALAPEDLLHDRHQAPVEAVLARAGRDASPLEARLQRVLAVGHFQALGAVQHDAAHLVRELLPRDIHGATVGVEHLVQHRQGHL